MQGGNYILKDGIVGVIQAVEYGGLTHSPKMDLMKFTLNPYPPTLTQ
jgi:hypothetical protein